MAAVKWSSFIIFSIYFLYWIDFFVSANDILGCGGFIQSHVNLDFSKVEVKLFTKQGSLKEKTECAPNNGYYFLPLYEHGEYVLKIEPPSGWSITPSEVSLNVDGETDPCSLGQDVNFSFTGFGITGRVVTAGESVGPAGVVVQLVNDKGEVRDTTTKALGDFHFTPVIPGKYTVKAYHNRWKLDPSSTLIQVTGGNTEMKTGSLAVKGYDVKGKVAADGRPIQGVTVMLYSAEDTKILQRIEGCDTSLLPGVKGNPICHVTSNSNGEFSFSLVPAGSYYLVPLTKTTGMSKISYNIHPKKVPFKVSHDGVNFGNIFEVSGFSVEGRVINHPGGAGMSGVHVSLIGQPTAVTGKDGIFTLTNLKPGTYTLAIMTDGCEFDDTKITIEPSGSVKIPDLYPSRWRVCGNVKSPSGVSRERNVSIKPNSNAPPRVTSTGDDGRWCMYLPPGVYSASVEVSENDKKEGMQFFPLVQKINVGYSPIDGIMFSQLKATLSGKIKCMEDGQISSCLNLPVTLRPVSLDGSYSGQSINTDAKDGKYSFKEILPGNYEVSIPSENLCWSTPKHIVVVSTSEATVPDFVHVGYAVSFAISHKSEVLYTTGNTKGSLEVPSGVSQHCLPQAGEYTFTPKGCHIYDPPVVTHSTRQSNNMVMVNAVSHAVGITVLSDEVVDDLKLRIGRDQVEEVGPLKPQPEAQDGMFVFRHTVMLPQGSTITVTPLSRKLLFSPSGPRSLGTSVMDCVETALQFTATRGKVLSGRVEPPIKDVVITLSGGEHDIVQNTGEDGKYHFGPLDASKTYTLRAEKDSYILTPPNDKGIIYAQKLAEIIVDVVDSTSKEPLQSALVSVSGDGSYRRNLATGSDGRLSFQSLAPGEYYLKPLMKEYKFTPPHRIIVVKEGETHSITLSGVRVACSGVGHVLTLGGSGVAGVGVVAEPQSSDDAVKCATEEGISERDTGLFRIRGLLRGCSYTVRIKQAKELGILHVIPPQINLKVESEAEDIAGLQFVAVQPLLVTDVNVLVYTPKIEHYKTLKLRLAAENDPSAHTFVSKLDASGYAPGINPGLMFTLPRLPADNRSYFLQLESTLSKNSHSYTLEPIYFNSDGKFKHFDMKFEPKVKVSENDLYQPSFLILPLLGILGIAYLNKEKVLEFLSSLFSTVSNRLATVTAQSKQNNLKNYQNIVDESQIDQLVQNINAVKKRPKLRKV